MRTLTTHKMIITQMQIRQLKADLKEDPTDLSSKILLARQNASLGRQIKRREFIDWDLRGQPRPRQR